MSNLKVRTLSPLDAEDSIAVTNPKFVTPALELTINSGEILPVSSDHKLDTEGDAVADDLTTITGGQDGQLLTLTAEDISRVVTIRHGVGNIFIADGNDISLTTEKQFVQLRFNAETNLWEDRRTGIGDGLYLPIDATPADINGFDEAVDDRIGNGLFVAGDNVAVAYDDVNNSFEVSVPSAGLDADTLDGEEGTFFQNADNIIAGELNALRLPALIQSDTDGTAAYATALESPRQINVTGEAVGTATFDGSADIDIVVTVDASLLGSQPAAYYLDRANHTGSAAQQPAIASITDNTGVTPDDIIAADGLTNGSGGTADGLISAVGDTSTVDSGATINDNFTEVATAISLLEANDSDLAGKIEEILVALRTNGLIAT